MAMLLRQWKVDATYSSRQLAHFTRAQLRLHAYYCFDTWRLRAARLKMREYKETAEFTQLAPTTRETTIAQEALTRTAATIQTERESFVSPVLSELNINLG